MASRPNAIKPLDRRIPKNPKFENVKSKLDTGASATKHNEKMEYISSHFKIRKDEVFRRIKVTTFAQLFLEVVERNEEVDEDELDEAATFYTAAGGAAPDVGTQRPGTKGGEAVDDGASAMTSRTAQSSFYNFVHGVGERVPESVASSMQSMSIANSPYLLLDLRDSEAYESCHILTARSYPHLMLNRSTNSFSADIHAYANKDGRIIILYDEDEKIATQAAAVFVQRGVDNIFVLSGGLRVLGKKFPEGFTVGALPPSCVEAPPKGAKKPAAPASGAAAAAAAPAAGAKVVALTRGNLQLIKDHLERNLLADDASSVTSRSLSTTSRTAGGATARSSTPASRPGTTSTRPPTSASSATASPKWK